MSLTPGATNCGFDDSKTVAVHEIRCYSQDTNRLGAGPVT